ncbi:MAG: 4Fe-4S binding protein [Chloroflexi bacterium]|nr:4Fe-4S binding protein [Chloroflexota bacterium]
MCVFCKKYGDPEVEGGLWYLNPKNYGRQLYRRRAAGAAFSEYGRAYRGTAVIEDPFKVRTETPEKVPEMVKTWWDNLDKVRPSQVIPVEDAIKVVALSHPFASMYCQCRQWTRAREERSEEMYSCGGLGVGMFKWERWPERYKGGLNFMTFEEGKDWVLKWTKKGMVPILMTYSAPYIGGLCLCDYPDCLEIRKRLDIGVSCLKGHYIAIVDYGKCNGCGRCVQRCQFGALKFEVTTNQANIDQYRCFGCGICAQVCARDAISLKRREDIPALAEVW